GMQGQAGRDSRAGWGHSHPWACVPFWGQRWFGGCPWCPCSSSAGPSHWKELKATCGGDRQSPVNIDRRAVPGLFPTPSLPSACPAALAVMLSLAGESASEHITVSGGGLPGRYRALQLHFHWGSPAGNGSEHTLDGRQLPMEMHIVHMNAMYQTLAEAKGHPNGLAVLGFFFQVGLQGPSRTWVLAVQLGEHWDSVDLASTFRLSTLLPPAPRLSGYYRYQGSLTTPDCSEAVVWTVFEEPVEIGREQLKAFVSTLHFPLEGSTLLKMINNFRPPQPLRSRKVFASRGATASGGSLEKKHLATLAG
uniref:Uncharacterized protein n=1 Tax=Geospiza parvula TaxID=87175 RepID=A0A8U8BPM4_GEOPR